MSEENGLYFELPMEAVELMKEADAGNEEAQYFFARYLLFDEHMKQREGLDREEIDWALGYWKRSAMTGCMGGGAALHLGDEFHAGRLVPRDIQAARMWYETAAMSGNPVAICMLGDMAAKGELGTADFQKAAECYIEAAPRFRDAYYRLGDMFAKGQFFRQDLEMARRLYGRVLKAEEALFERHGYYSDAYYQVNERLEAMSEPITSEEGVDTPAQAKALEAIAKLLEK